MNQQVSLQLNLTFRDQSATNEMRNARNMYERLKDVLSFRGSNGTGN